MSMKMKDARLVIRAKQKQKTTQKKIFDARQILRQKTNWKARGAAHLRSQPPVNLFKRQFRQVFNQQRTGGKRTPNNKFGNRGSYNRFSNRNQLGLDKKVLVGKSGILKVTSRAQKQMELDVRTPEDKCIVSNKTGITVTMRNKPSQHVAFGDPMEDDELEKLTLQDLAEIKNVQSYPSNLFSLPKVTTRGPAASTSSQSLALINRLHGDGKTMIADTVVPSSHTQSTWKVLVTNLQPSVSEEDITELFGHVGTMRDASLLRPGLAVVEYYSRKDALLACDTYHNRLLDGQPMHCTIEGESQSSRTPVTMRLGDKYVSTATSVPRFQRQTASSIFTQSSLKPSSLSAPRSVEFTVKVP